MKSFLEHIKLKEATQRIERVLGWMDTLSRAENAMDYDQDKVARLEAQIERATAQMSDNELAQCGLWDDLEDRRQARAEL